MEHDEPLDSSVIIKATTNLNCTIEELKLGIIQFTCWSEQCDMPIGMVWVRARPTQTKGEKVGEIIDCYTTEWARRCGVCKFLYNEVLKKVDILRTSVGSDEGGKDFLENFGFKYDKNIGMWYVKKEYM